MQPPQSASWSAWAWNGTVGRFWPSSAPSSSPSAAKTDSAKPESAKVDSNKTDSTAKTYTMVEVKKHTTEADCWLVIANKVYNVTPFLEEHPGGAEQLLGEAGQDATRSFRDVGHSAEAQITLARFYIGELTKATTG